MGERICPVWVGYLLANPLRRLIQNPDKILAPCVTPGMTVLDAGCAMGFFSLPAARLAGPQGRVICVDCQEKMLIELQRRSIRAGLGLQMKPHLCGRKSLGLKDYEEKVDGP
jgi:2-polyprenyl-3-methyl-5-hydroxy-6-metoxy-1,4-benzoquinol methylase